MGDAKTDLLQGTLDLIVLRLLRGGPANGWDITQSIQLVSKGALQNIAARPPEIRGKRGFAVFAPQFRVHFPPAFEMRVVRVHEHAVHVKDHGESLHLTKRAQGTKTKAEEDYGF